MSGEGGAHMGKGLSGTKAPNVTRSSRDERKAEAGAAGALADSFDQYLMTVPRSP